MAIVILRSNIEYILHIKSQKSRAIIHKHRLNARIGYRKTCFFHRTNDSNKRNTGASLVQDAPLASKF